MCEQSFLPTILYQSIPEVTAERVIVPADSKGRCNSNGAASTVFRDRSKPRRVINLLGGNKPRYAQSFSRRIPCRVGSTRRYRARVCDCTRVKLWSVGKSQS